MSNNNTKHFLYFAYGSNLLKERLQLNNPSAEFYCKGRIKDYTLNFGNWKGVESSWHGGAATITESLGDDVWGAVWKMNKSDLQSLDKQECVEMGMYRPLEVTVETEKGELSCRTYKMNECVVTDTSPQYKQVVCLGAKQNNLPVEYIKKLEAIETNNYSGPTPLNQIEDVMK
ncbi:gamma-glutamylcyclotransferase-like [Polyodon spathula]|uniref:gamma-glutamylcyclotransferase-like n=1 Tax=Polyodon spathula TaxID=7913 RepID=UPI001B7E8217|nr:gamma-glutamylcyclotransferase-like [Polyodon spathula]